MSSPKVIILGSGNVASHLLEAFVAAQVSCGLWSHNAAHARALAARYAGDTVEVFDSLADIPRDSFFYVIAVSDNAVAAVAADLGPVEGVVVHTSGSVPLQEPYAGGRYGGDGFVGIAADAVTLQQQLMQIFHNVLCFFVSHPVGLCRVPMTVHGFVKGMEESVLC